MSIPGSASPLFIGAAAADAAAFQIDRSIRLNSADSAFLNRTPSSVSNRRTWTYSCWAKRTTISSGSPRLFGTYDSSFIGWNIEISSSDKLEVHYSPDGSSYPFRRTTTQVFRDPSAWYHFVVAVDTTASTAGDRVKLYVNGSQITAFDNNANGSQNTDTNINTATQHRIGYNYTYSDLYLAEINFIDGQALAPTDFGETDDNNVWQPKDTSGLTFGTNGFRLKLDDNSSNAALGNDSSGNSNTWTVNNLTATVGTVYSATSSGMSTPGLLFDGDTSTSPSLTADGTVYTMLTGVSIACSSSLRINANANNFQVSVNGGSYTSAASVNSTYLSLSVPSGNTLTSLTFKDGAGGGYGVRALEVDGTVLVDGDTTSIDSLIDTPTNYSVDSGNPGGNYAVLNPLDKSTTNQGTYANGNLEFTKTSSGYASAKASIGMTSGKWYCEVTKTSTGTNTVIGVHDETPIATYLDKSAAGYGWRSDGVKVNNDIGGANIGGYAEGDVMGLAFDADAKALYFYKNGSLAGSFTGITPSDATHFFAFSAYDGKTIKVNFGQRPFIHTVPTGYSSLVTTNLPDPTIPDGSTAFNTLLYTGDGQSSKAVTGYGFSPDFLWIKERSSTSDHGLWNTVVGSGKYMSSNLTASEYTTGTELSSIDSAGFTVGANTMTNQSSETYAAWAWDAGTSTASNTDGSITSSVRASQTNGCSIVTYTGNSNSSKTIGHGLNAAPEMIIIKCRNASSHWVVYHKSTGNNAFCTLNRTNASSDLTGSGVMNTTSPTSSVFTVGDYSGTGDASRDFVAYCFASVEGFSSFGSYTGNGSSTDGAIVFTGMRPRWVLIKASDNASQNWYILDAARDPHNLTANKLEPNTNNSENASPNTATTNSLDLLSNGFKLRTSNDGTNKSSTNYIYAAFGDPFKTARAR